MASLAMASQRRIPSAMRSAPHSVRADLDSLKPIVGLPGIGAALGGLVLGASGDIAAHAIHAIAARSPAAARAGNPALLTWIRFWMIISPQARRLTGAACRGRLRMVMHG